MLPTFYNGGEYMEEFIGFTFAGIHSSKYGLYAVTDGTSYSMPLFADFMDKTESVDGFDGVYYFGTDYSSKPRRVNCVVDYIDENTLRSIQNWLNPKRIGKLTFDEAPYKYYIAKVTQKPDFTFYPQSDSDDGHLYVGTFIIEFTAFDPFAYSYVNSVDSYTYYEESQGLWYHDSGILYEEETPSSTIENITGTTNILLYNGGNQRAKPIITIIGSADDITVLNQTTKQQFTLTGLSNVTIIVDCQKGHVKVSDVLASSYHEGGFIEIEGSSRVDRYLNVNFTNTLNTITITENVDLDIIGRLIAVDNDWYEILDCDFDTGTITLDKNFEGLTDTYDISVIDLNKINISGTNLNITSMEFDYKFRYL